MTGRPTSASTGSPLAGRSFIPGTSRFVRFIALFAGSSPTRSALFRPPERLLAVHSGGSQQLANAGRAVERGCRNREVLLMEVA